jgi:hypothetical protein
MAKHIVIVMPEDMGGLATDIGDKTLKLVELTFENVEDGSQVYCHMPLEGQEGTRYSITVSER